jgi:RNA polymerase sigma factor (sigma-70 family)
MIKEYSQEEKAAMAIQYKPLVIKLTNQFYRKTLSNWEELESMAYEGLCLAMNKYDSEKSKMSFLSYAAFEIRHNIMNRMTEESRTVKLPYQEQQKLKDAGKSTCNVIYFDITDDMDDDSPRRNEIKNGLYESSKFDDGDVYEYLYERLETNFSERDCKMFYMTFGLKGYEEIQNRQIAKMIGVSEGLVSQRKKAMIEFIRADNDLCEMLANLCKQ